MSFDPTPITPRAYEANRWRHLRRMRDLLGFSTTKRARRTVVCVETGTRYRSAEHAMRELNCGGSMYALLKAAYRGSTWRGYHWKLIEAKP